MSEPREQRHHERADVERALLGAVLVAPELIGAAAEVVTPGDFAKRGHGATWEALLRLDEDDRPLDLVTLKSELVEMRQLDVVGGPTYLGALVDGVPRVGEGAVTHWARQIRDTARLRRLGDSLRELLRLAEAGALTADELQASIERTLTDAPPGAAVLPRASVAAATWSALEAEVTGKADGITTGFPGLDVRLRFGGWRPGQLVYVGARTSRGKSALLLGFAETAAALGRRVLFVPLEMTPVELGVRRLVSHAGVGVAGLHSWRSSERSRVLEALGRSRTILDRPLDFTGKDVRTLAAIRAAARRQRQRHGLDLLVVDYLGLVQYGPATKLSLYERTTLVSQGLKAIAMDLEVPVLCAVQLNRETVAQGNRGPSLAHFRDSGAIEQDCDIALLIHQSSARDAIEDGDVELIIAKQRNGWTGSVPAVWRAACARFEPVPDGLGS